MKINFRPTMTHPNRHVAACFCLGHCLISQQQQREQKGQRVPDDRGRTFGTWQWHKDQIKFKRGEVVTLELGHTTDFRCLSQSEIGQHLFWNLECELIFTESAPLGRFSHRVAMSVCVIVCAIGCNFFPEASHWPWDHMVSSRSLKFTYEQLVTTLRSVHIRSGKWKPLLHPTYLPRVYFLSTGSSTLICTYRCVNGRHFYMQPIQLQFTFKKLVIKHFDLHLWGL